MILSTSWIITQFTRCAAVCSITVHITNVTIDAATVSSDDDPASFGKSVLLENGSYIISEEYYIGDYVNDKTAQNELFDILDDTVLDFSESNPFGDPT